MGSKRLYGIDLLRMLAMSFVIIGHIVGQGGVLEAAKNNIVNHELALFFAVFSLCSINIFGLISGYVGYDSKFNFRRVVLLWMQVLFWTTTISCFFAAFKLSARTPRLLRNAFFPILSGTYWYMTGYFLVIFIAPVMNRVITKFPLWLLVTGTAMAALLLSVVITTSGNNGIWLCLEYMIGAIIKKSGIAKYFKPLSAFLGYILCVLTTWLLASVQDVGWITWNKYVWSVWGGGRADGLWPSSVTMNLAAVFLLLWAINIQLPEKMESYIKSITPLILSVYLIHAHPLVFDWFGGRFAAMAQNGVFMVGGIAGSCLAIFACCAALDWTRLLLFSQVKKYWMKGQRMRNER